MSGTKLTITLEFDFTDEAHRLAIEDLLDSFFEDLTWVYDGEAEMGTSWQVTDE